MSTVPYVNENIRREASETFANLMDVQASEVPKSLVDMWQEVQHMANRLQPGEMDVRQMATLVVLDRRTSGKATEDSRPRATGGRKTF